MNRRMLLESLLKRLPNEFQEVKYLESSGTQYIDTGYAPTSNFRVGLEFEYNSVSDVSVLIGTYVHNGVNFNDNRNLLRLNSDRTLVMQVSTIATQLSSITTSVDTKYKLSAQFKNNPILNINGMDYTNNANFINNNISLYVFANHSRVYNVDTANNLISMKLYSCQIYDNYVLVRNFVPCYRKADNVAGLYDLVNGVFYTNAGSGTFIVGGNV